MKTAAKVKSLTASIITHTETDQPSSKKFKDQPAEALLLLNSDTLIHNDEIKQQEKTVDKNDEIVHIDRIPCQHCVRKFSSTSLVSKD